MATKKSDNFLRDEIQQERSRFSYIDGFRFGFGFFISWLLGLLLVGLVAWGLSFVLHP